MDMNNYQRRALSTAIYPNIGRNIIYPTLGLMGEAGELCNKVKKLVRDGDYKEGSNIPNHAIDSLALELGDAFWYISAIASELGLSLSDIALSNLDKLSRRADDGTLGGSGDQR